MDWIPARRQRTRVVAACYCPRRACGRACDAIWDMVRYVTGVYSDVHLQTAAPVHLMQKKDARSEQAAKSSM